MSSASSPVELVDNVAFSDGNLTWTRAGASEKVDGNELLFILESPKKDSSASEFLISLLKEDPEDKEKPYRLSLFRAATIPPEISQQYIIRQLPPYLNYDVSNQVDVIVSTKSGTGLAPRVWGDVLEPLWDFIATHLGVHGIPQDAGRQHYRLTTTQSAETIRDFAKDLWASAAHGSKSRTIVLLSGDGGVVDLLNGSEKDVIHETLPLIAVLPVGTGNALFHSIHKPLYATPGPTPLVHGLRTLFQGAPFPLPTFRASFPPGSRIVTFADKSNGTSAAQIAPEEQFAKKETSVSHLNGAIVASYGFHASIVHESDTPEYRVHGSKRFGMVAQELLRESHPYAARVAVRRPGSSELETIPRDAHAYVLATLVSDLERGFTISPASRPLRGHLRLVHFGPVGGERTMEVMMKAYDAGKHVGLEWDDGEKVAYDEVDEVQVTVQEDDERWRKICIDGTIVEVPKGGQVSVRVLEQGPLRVLAHPQIFAE